MILSRHLQVQNTLVEFLSGIKQPDYRSDVEIVTPRLLDLRSLERFPSISVLRGPWRNEWASEDKDLKRRTAAFAIVGFIRSQADDTFEGRMTEVADRFEADIVNRIERHEDEFLAAADAESILISQGEAVLSDDEVKGIIQLVAEVVYEYSDDLIIST